MMNKKIVDSAAIGILFSRPPATEELEITAWKAVHDDILEITKSANAVIGIHAETGAGKTTFIRQLANVGADRADILVLNPTATAMHTGWISQGLSQWLTSDSANTRQFQQKFSGLKDTARPILLCLDITELADPTQMAGELSALLNLADGSGIKLSIVVSCTDSLWQSLSNCQPIEARILYVKALPSFSDQELAELINRKLLKHPSLRGTLDASQVLNLAKNAAGSPLRITRLVCAQLGIEIPTTTVKSKRNEKNTSGKKTKNQQDQIAIPFDDLLAPESSKG
jgi:type II secretory pathway predicted ATPase ExeA